ncbi:hypothetical protein QQZ08_011557 [Neonectria magnoliae]|uniref:DUF7492 domain-containing protein n=1 Tax=Neonectria magnoliae TaxID=2732573 RepID=A0ABR1H9E4_9HYPO
MAARVRSRVQKRKRAFLTRSQGMIRKVKEMHRFTDAKTAVVGIHNGKMFWYDEAGVFGRQDPRLHSSQLSTAKKLNLTTMQSMIVTLALVGNTVAHSWIEQVMRIALSGTLVEPVGYMRGYVGRMDPDFADPANTHLLPPNGREVGNVLLPDDAMCATAQRTSNYTAEHPMLSAALGDLIALRYQENGHVLLPEGSPNKP